MSRSSIFPRIAGLSIASAIYMVSERASDVIIAAYAQKGMVEDA